MWTNLNGVEKPWVVFVEAIVAKENLPSWDKLWDDLSGGDLERSCARELFY